MNNFEPRATDTKDPMRSKYAEAMNSSVPDKLNRLKGSIERVIGQFKDKVIVSIGCGTGKLEENLAKLLPAKVYAIDLSLPMLEDIKDEDNFSRKVDSGEPRWQGNLEKIQANGLSLPIPDKKADLIVVHSVVHEVNSYEAAFKMELAGKTGEFFGHLAQKLNQGGELNYRDFIAPSSPEELSILKIGKKTEGSEEMEPLAYLEFFANNFEGEDVTDLQNQIANLKKSGGWNEGARLILTRRLRSEIALHYSWSRSAEKEIKERYLYLPLDETAKFIQSAAEKVGIELEVVESYAATQKEYADHILGPLIFEKSDGSPDDLPAITASIVVRRRPIL